MVSLLIKLMKKDVKFVWSAECKAAFQQLKHRFILVPILTHFDTEKQIIIKTDTVVGTGIYFVVFKTALIHRGLLRSYIWYSQAKGDRLTKHN